MKVIGRLRRFVHPACWPCLSWRRRRLYLFLRHSLPQTEGKSRSPGSPAPVEILRDAYGIPHIFAASLDDAHFALGFVHAQDRLWQMEMNRRIAAGRLAEILGPGALESDRFMRTLGVRRVGAKPTSQHYDAETRRLLDAYAAGVNAFLADAAGAAAGILADARRRPSPGRRPTRSAG